jgi:hypothetical protein
MNYLPSYLMPETIAYLAQCSTKPSQMWTQALNTFIRKMVISGDWVYLDGLWIFATPAGCRSNALINIKNPMATKAVEQTNGGTLTWGVNTGYLGDGVKSYIDTSFNPKTTGVNYTLNNASLGVYSHTNTYNATTPYYDFGSYDNTNASAINTSVNGITSNGYCNDTIASTVLPTTSDSFALNSIVRTSSTSLSYWKRGSSLATSSVTSTAIPNLNLWALGLNNNGSILFPSVRVMSMVYIGSGNLSQSNFYTYFQAFATTVGFNV